MKTAVIQMNSGPEKKKNIARAAEFVREAIQRQAHFITLPEVFNYRRGIDLKTEIPAIAENIPGDSLTPLVLLAKTHKVFILGGSIYEKTRFPDKVYNTSVLIGPGGLIVHRYRKINLFEAMIDGKKIQESRHFLPGKKTTMSLVGKFRTGFSICYDLRFPELYRTYARRGAHILCVPSCFTKKTGTAHWETLLKARAIENLSYVVAPNQIGRDARGVAAFGHSLIVGPWGEILARASADQEEVIYAQIDLKEIRAKRKILPALSRSK